MKAYREKTTHTENLQGEFSATYTESKEAPNNDFHIHEAYELMLILSEDVWLDINEEVYPVPYGSLLFFNPMDLHRIRYRGNLLYQRFVLWFKPAFLQEIATLRYPFMRCFFMRGREKANLLPLTDTQLASVRPLFERLCCAPSWQGQAREMTIRLRLGELLIAVQELLCPLLGQSDQYELSQEQAVYCAIQYIQEHYTEVIRLQDIAKLTGMNKKELCAAFQAVTGMACGQYLLQYRITTAKALLIQGLSVTQVCEATGFGDCCNFSRTFHNHVGLSPKQYAMQQRNATQNAKG